MFVFVFLTMNQNLLSISASVKILNCNLILDNDLEIDTAENKINLWKLRNREKKKKLLNITRDEFDFWSLDAFKSWEVACVVAEWELSMLEPISSEK